MKYTALYWALRFVETELGIHKKEYGGFSVTIYADRQEADFGRIHEDKPFLLNRHKDFVILELIDRLLSEGHLPDTISIDVDDFVILRENGREITYQCEAWDDYQKVAAEFHSKEHRDGECLYTSRLVSGLLEYKGLKYENGAVQPFGYIGKSDTTIGGSEDFVIEGTELVCYKGNESTVTVPDGIESLGASAFWNNTSVKEVKLPETLERIGGDCFYYCTDLEKITIPAKVHTMGNNPFAGCPKLHLTNESPFFTLENGVLFDAKKTNLIYFPIEDERREYAVPTGVICLGKHCFYACDTLRKITVPESVIRFENNPFSGCTKLKLESKTPYYLVENGVIYNKFKTTVIGCLNGSQIDCLTVPESVTLISRNSFWNCKGVKKIVLTKNIDRIGYNPFAGCENLLIENKDNSYFFVDKGIVFNKTRTHLLCATDRAIGEKYRVPDGVTHINRGVFSGCKSLKEIDYNGVTYIDKSSFTNCTRLTELYIPDDVTYIGEWAFSYCTNLRKISINKKTFVDKNAFNECPAVIEWRESD